MRLSWVDMVKLFTVKLVNMSITSRLSPEQVTTTPTEPPFWDDVLTQIPLCNELVKKHSLIHEELESFVKNDRPFMNYPKYGNLYSRTWEAFPLSIFEGEFVTLTKGQLGFDLDAFVKKARVKLPVISALFGPLEAEGHLRNVFVSRLLPGSQIHPHRGWTPEFLRIHLGLTCDPLCKITVGHQTKTWEPGKLLAFRDGGPYLHSVSHQGHGERIVMSVDLRMSYVQQFLSNPPL
jgi:hypothetical protein